MFVLLASLIGMMEGAAQPSVAEIADALQTTQSQIISLELAVNFEHIAPLGSPTTELSKVAYLSVEYWRWGQRSHWRAKCPASTDDYYLFDGKVIRILNFSPDATGQLAPNAHLRIAKRPGYEDIPSLLMWTIGSEPLWISMTKAGSGAKLQTDPTNEAKVSVSWKGTGFRAVAVFDRNRNWATESLTLDFDNGQHGELRGANFSDHGAGVFLPARIGRKVWSNYASRDRFYTINATVEKARINPNVSEAIVIPRYPQGCMLVDEISGKKFSVDNTGRQIGPAADIVPVTPLPLPPVPNPISPDEGGAWHWLIAAGVSLIVAAVGLYLLRTRRRIA